MSSRFDPVVLSLSRWELGLLAPVGSHTHMVSIQTHCSDPDPPPVYMKPYRAVLDLCPNCNNWPLLLKFQATIGPIFSEYMPESRRNTICLFSTAYN